MTAFETELVEQLHATHAAAALADLAGDDLLADAMRTRLADLTAIAEQHAVSV